MRPLRQSKRLTSVSAIGYRLRHGDRFHRDGDDLVPTHYCSAGNQPRMRATTLAGNVLTFDYDGGTNIDPKVTSHMHAVTLEFLGPDEIRARWENWSKGAADPAHLGVFRVVRKK